MINNKWLLTIFFFYILVNCHSQNQHTINATFNETTKTIAIKQSTTFSVSNNISLDTLVFNDWNNAYWDKKSPLGYRFSDQFVRSFHLSKADERGKTEIHELKINGKDITQNYVRDFDLIKVANTDKSSHFQIEISYTITLPNSNFSGYGIDKKGNTILKDWLILPAKINEDKMIAFHNENLLDAALPLSNFSINFDVELATQSFLNSNAQITSSTEKSYILNANNVKNIEIQLLKNNDFYSYQTQNRIVYSNLYEKKITLEQQIQSIQKITQYIDDALLIQHKNNVLVSQYDYERSPLYGLNQLPSFISPFDNQLIFELKFLKTYIAKVTEDIFSHNPRTETWITDGYQTYLIMQYMQTFYPNTKMLGKLSHFKFLNYYSIFQRDFNDQFEIVYLLMARKNLDQPVGNSKDTFIKFNEQISGRYKSGLNFKYWADYLGQDFFIKKLQHYSLLSQRQETSETDFFNLLAQNAPKTTNWFADLVHSNQLIDYKIKASKKTTNGVELHLKNKTNSPFPTTLYTIKNDTITNKYWIPAFKNDTIINFTDTKQKYALNYFGEVPEIFRGNNWQNPNAFLGISKPIKLTLIRDLEDPDYNQLFFLPEFSYNYYDGISPAISFNNKSVFIKPFTFDVAPTLSWNTKKLIGNASFTYNQMFRDQKLFNIRYNVFGHTYHYAPNARYYKFSPSVTLNFRDLDLRKNSSKNIIFRYVLLDREKSNFLNPKEENYAVFNLKLNSSEHEFTRLYRYGIDVQTANKFGKLSGNIHFRKLFSDNRHFTVRGYAGVFLYRKTTSNFFDFGVDKPTDYLYDYGLLGRSESTGLYSQQYIVAEGGFKSMFENRYANQWLATTNLSYTLWNWIEGYSDFGFMKNKNIDPTFIYDSGIRLNLVQDYFELYFPVYSNNGWEIAQPNYHEKVRFVFTLSPKTLFSLFTRKWF